MKNTAPVPTSSSDVRYDNTVINTLTNLGLTLADAMEALRNPTSEWVDSAGLAWSKNDTIAVASNRSRTRIHSVCLPSAVTPPPYADRGIRLSETAASTADELGIDHASIIAAVEAPDGWERPALAPRTLRRIGDFVLVVRAGIVVDILDAETSAPFFDDTEIDGIVITPGMHRFVYFSPTVDLDTVVATAVEPEWMFDSLDGHTVAVRGENAVVIHHATQRLRLFGSTAQIVDSRVPVTHRGVTATSRVASLLDYAGTSLDEMADTIKNPIAIWRGDSNLTMYQGPSHTFGVRYTDGLVVALVRTEEALATRNETHIGDTYVFERVRETIDLLGCRDAVAKCLRAPTHSWINEYGNTVKRGFGVEVTLTPSGALKWFEKVAPPMRTAMTVPRLALAG